MTLSASRSALNLGVRGFVYPGEVQMVAARMYEGLTTNLLTKGGGLAVLMCSQKR